MSQQASDEKPKANYYLIRFRQPDKNGREVVSLSTGDGTPLLGVLQGDETDTMREAIEAVRDIAVALEVKL